MAQMNIIFTAVFCQQLTSSKETNNECEKKMFSTDVTSDKVGKMKVQSLIQRECTIALMKWANLLIIIASYKILIIIDTSTISA